MNRTRLRWRAGAFFLEGSLAFVVYPLVGTIVFGRFGIFLGPMLLVLIVHFADLVLPELVDGGTPI
ncbi:MAG: hypothetical protein ACOCY7_00290 [Halodesulfurarchaeum sp.]